MKQSLSEKIGDFLLGINFPSCNPKVISIYAFIFSCFIVAISALAGSFSTIGIIICILITLLSLCLFTIFLIDYIKEKETGGIVFESIVIIIFLCASITISMFMIEYSHEGDYSDHECAVAPWCEKNAEGYIKINCSFNREYYCKEHLDDEIERRNGGDSSSDKKPSYDSSAPSFSNKYGTPTTKCYISGCDNYIASSGDTNCCTTHSNRCGNCRCYIDSDAMYCMDCLEDALGK